MRALVFILLIVVAADVHSQTERKFVRKGNSNFKDGQYQQAEVEYRKALEKDPDSYKADYNLGNALYKQKQFDAAAGRYAELVEKEVNKEQLDRYYYNLGNSMFESKKYKESVEAYKMALRNSPGDMDAKHNLQMAMRMLTEQQKQQQQKQKQEQGKNQQEQNQQQQKKEQEKNQQEEAQQQPQPQKGQISPEDAERILQALENEEKEVMKKVQERKEHVSKVPVDKNW